MKARHFLATFSAVLAMCTSASAAPALWKISDEDSSIWLFGSVHLLPPDIDWRSEVLDDLLQTADRVYFETDISPEAQLTITPLTIKLGFSNDGTLLNQHIGPELTDRLREAAKAYDMPMPFLLTMQPWMAATTISVGVMAGSGYDPTLGVENVLGREVPKERQGFLETPEEQIGFLGGGTMGEQIAMLEATLDTLHVMMTDLDAMVAAWMDGDPDALGEIFMEQMGGYDSGMVSRLIDQRNANWTDQIAGMLERNEEALLIVGAAHMTGSTSVVKMLQKRGYSSERIQ